MKQMKLTAVLCFAALFAAAAAIIRNPEYSASAAEDPAVAADPAPDPASPTGKPKMQVVFLLDATGSMSGLIGAAKDKIWSIASSLTQTRPEPDIEFGMIFYRDRGDSFVTRQIQLGTPMDDIYEVLMSMTADEGGDTPESVNQALHEAINDMKWDDLEKTYRTVFLVGDCPPHMDYRNDVKYHASCSAAVQKGIIVNTILMGGDPDAYPIWKEIAALTDGEFIQTDMQVNDIGIATPYDESINKLQYELDNTRVYYGKAKEMTESKKAQSDKFMEVVEDAAAARRAEFNISEAGKKSYYGSNELLNDIEGGKKLSDISEKDLPEEMRKMPEEGRQKYIDGQLQKRREIVDSIARLSLRRQQYIDSRLEEMDEKSVESSFDAAIFNAVRSQAAEKQIAIEGKTKR